MVYISFLMENHSTLKTISAYHMQYLLISCYVRLPDRYLIPMVSPCTCFYGTPDFWNTAIYFVQFLTVCFTTCVKVELV